MSEAFFTFGMQIITFFALGVYLDDINAQPKLFTRSFYTDYLLDNPDVDVDDVFRSIFDDQPQPVIPDVEDVGESLQVGGLENLLGFIALEGARTHLQLGVQVRHDLTEELLQDFAQALA